VLVLCVIMLGILLTAGCDSATWPTTPVPLPLPLPTATRQTLFPTPAAPGNIITWQALQVSLESVEITDSFSTEFGAQRLPSPGQKFLWVQVQLENTATDQFNLPTPEHFSVLYAASEFKPTYGHRQGYADYTALNSPLFPGQFVEAWLRFDIPLTANLAAVQFVFLPESTEIGVSPSAPSYPWGGEHPLFVWNCAP
jgi:hypothetical protein